MIQQAAGGDKDKPVDTSIDKIDTMVDKATSKKKCVAGAG